MNTAAHRFWVQRPVNKGHGSSDGKHYFLQSDRQKKFVETNLIEEIVNNINCMEKRVMINAKITGVGGYVRKRYMTMRIWKALLIQTTNG